MIMVDRKAMWSNTTGKPLRLAQLTATEKSSNEVTAACNHSLISSAAGRLIMLDMSSMSSLNI